SRYATTYSFGAYLIRNYGIDLLPAMVQSQQSGIPSIEAALAQKGYEERFGTLLQQWAVSIILSKREIAPSENNSKLLINTGSWLQDSGDYKLGSINYFLIDKKETSPSAPDLLGPTIHTSSPTEMAPYSIYFVQPTSSTTGEVNYNLQVPANISVIAIKEKL
ncbi:MAG: hypothetical protein JXR63_13380, partial [Spirochaetales bacterium]|nr:hypothetical protein [Spirochaetales bacterium]